MKATMHAYLQALEAGDLTDLTRLFAEDAVVVSPLYGEQSAPAFFRQLLADTDHSVITPLRLFYEETERSGAAHFLYEWILNGGRHVAFEVVDLFRFDDAGKIQELRIIYDTARTRTALEERGD